MGASRFHTSILHCTKDHEDENRVHMHVRTCNSVIQYAV